jgi:hypothetical protein
MISMKILMNMFPKIAQALQYVLTDKVNELAKKRLHPEQPQKKTGSNSVKALLFAWMQNHSPFYSVRHHAF